MMALNKFLHILVWNIFILYSCSGEYDITKFSLSEERPIRTLSINFRCTM